MAIVYLADDLKHGRRVALKVMKPEISASLGPERFMREIAVAAQLNHPHILPLFDSGKAGDHLYYVMPYVEGESLRLRLNRDKQLPIEDALRLTREIAAALAHAHQRGIVHRDIKPENILLSHGMALVADFGLARAVATEEEETVANLTGRNALLGTPAYMSPEQASGGEIDARTDLYALACVLFEMLAGQPPFIAPTADALLRMQVAASPRSVSEHRPTVSRGIAAFIARGLSKLPADRFPTAARFSEALEFAVQDSLGGGATIASPARPAANNLPKPRTQFIGREAEVTDCARILARAQLLTLTGIGGYGKTRLAIEVARRIADRFPDGVWFADLAPISDGVRAVEMLATTLGVQAAPGADRLVALRRHVQGKRLLLVLDNCEHLAAACAEIADPLLQDSEELRILATSREGLSLEGEQLFALGTMDVPSPDAAKANVETSDAVRLFVDRARMALPAFALTSENAPAVAEICRRLDGIPLALELAAARVKILSVDQIRSKLDDRFRLLTDSSKAAQPRQGTLRATIQWSYDQLALEEQRFFRNLSVFAGGWTLESAMRVAAPGWDEYEVLDGLTRLVDKSLVVVEREQTAEPRYGLLETVRQYAQERLNESGEGEATRLRHLSELTALAESAYAERFVREEAWSERIEVEHDNLRTALAWARATDGERYLVLAGALAWFWQARSYLIEAREHMRAALAASSPTPIRPARARALWGAASVLAWQGDPAAAQSGMEDALRMWRDLGDSREVALALEGIGWAQLLAGDDDAARRTFEEALRMQRELGEPMAVNRSMSALAQTCVALGRVEEARAMATEVIAFSEAHGDRRHEHFGWHYLADCALIEGHCEESLRLYRRSLELALALGDRVETSFEVQGVAMSLAGLGQPERALRLASAAHAEWERVGADIHVRFWDVLLERTLGEARRALGDEAASAARAEGKRMPFDAAVNEALGTGRVS